MPTIRNATPADCEVIASLWHAAWHDAHAGIVASRLLPHRTLEYFRKLANAQVDKLNVAFQGEQLVGFVSVDGDELKLLFVAAAARGTGVADALIAHAQRQIVQHHCDAHLLVVERNARARRFYERHGFRDAGLVPYEAAIPGGSVAVPHRRYEKSLR